MEWVENVKRALGVREMSVEIRKVVVHDKNEKRAVLNT